MIPKTIHYCWFGHTPKPALFQRCINSWRKYCPDYQIIEWNEDNFDINCNAYVREAYEAKKWAFVTDYARLWVVYNHGGIYLDTDVELVKPLDDLLEKSAYFGFEDSVSVNTGLGFGAKRSNTVIECMMKDYSDIHFLKSDGSYDTTPCPIRNTKAIAHLLVDKKMIGNTVEIDGAVIYPPEYFCPLEANGVNLKKTKNTHSIHWFSATWLSEDEQIVHQYRVFRGKCEKLFGKRFGGYIARGIYLFFPRRREVLKRM